MIEAMKLALEALKWASDQTEPQANDHCLCPICKGIDALNQAIEQAQKPEHIQKLEELGWSSEAINKANTPQQKQEPDVSNKLHFDCEFVDGTCADLTVYGSERDIKRLEARIKFWWNLEQAQKQEPMLTERESVAVWLEKECDEQYLADRVRAGDHAKEKAAKKRQFQCGSDSHLSSSLVGVGEIDSTTQKQEPVGWVHLGEVFWKDGTPEDGTDIYATPPQRQPLTDEQIEKIYYAIDGNEFPVDFCRAIEAAHGIKGDA